MVMPLTPHRWTEAEYLAFERSSNEKHEYYRGEIYDMAGASDDYNTITMNTAAGLHAQLRKHPCRVYQSDMRVAMLDAKFYTYPDVVVACGERLFTDEQPDTLLNPTLIIEVLSPSTQNYDRKAKSGHFRTLKSLQEYVLIWQDQVKVEHYIRQADGEWLVRDIFGLQASIELNSIQCRLALADVYEKVEFGEED